MVLTTSEAIHTGEESAVLRVAYAKLGIELDIKELPPRRSLEDANDGFADGEVGRVAGLEKEFTNLIRIDVPIKSIETMAYFTHGAVTINGLADLTRYRIGILEGMRLSEELTKGMHPISVDSWEKLYTLLEMGRLDVILASREIQEEWHDIPQTRNLESVQLQPQGHAIYHYLNKRHLDFAPVIRMVLQDMRQTGEMRKILLQASMN